MFGLSREERADRICAGFQREIFENSLSLAVPLAAEERPWSDETTIWKLAELVAFFLHCLGRYTIRGPDLRFRERVQMETGYAEFAAIVHFAYEMYANPIEGLEDKVRDLFHKRELEYLGLPLLPEDRTDSNQVAYRAAEYVMRAAGRPLDDETRQFMAKVLLDAARLDDLAKRVDKVARLLGVPDTAPPMPGG